MSFTRSLALNLMGKGRDIRVNAVAPGPIWYVVFAGRGESNSSRLLSIAGWLAP